LRGWLPLRRFPLEPFREIPISPILRVPRDGIRVVVVECFDYEFKIVIGKVKFHIVER
jgi:hypothetical protein